VLEVGPNGELAAKPRCRLLPIERGRRRMWRWSRCGRRPRVERRTRRRGWGPRRNRSGDWRRGGACSGGGTVQVRAAEDLSRLGQPAPRRCRAGPHVDRRGELSSDRKQCLPRGRGWMRWLGATGKRCLRGGHGGRGLLGATRQRLCGDRASLATPRWGGSAQRLVRSRGMANFIGRCMRRVEQYELADNRSESPPPRPHARHPVHGPGHRRARPRWVRSVSRFRDD
jgi:hypothetical protein